MSQFSAAQLLTAATQMQVIRNMKNIMSTYQRRPMIPTAAVLVPLCSFEEPEGVDPRVSLLYTRRSLSLRSHGGQISFPGGKIDKNETVRQAALRETKEELGINSKNIDVWAEGPLVPGKSRYTIIAPVIGCIKDIKISDLKPNNSEVSEVIAIDIEELCKPDNQFYTQFQNNYLLPVFSVGDNKIWGITAYITHIVLQCLLPQTVYHNEWMTKKIPHWDSVQN